MAIHAHILGTVFRDSERKTSKNGKDYMRFTIRDGDGDNSQYVSVTSFDTADMELADRITKGATVYCEGRLSQNKWTQQDGTERYGLQLVSSYIRLPELERSKRSKNGGKSQAHGIQAPTLPLRQEIDDEIPF